VIEFGPQQFAGLRSAVNPVRETQPFGTKGLDRGRRRAGAPKGPEELAQAFLNTDIGIQTHTPGGVVVKADRQAYLQFATACLVEDAAA
jgi:hypothetical protein